MDGWPTTTRSLERRDLLRALVGRASRKREGRAAKQRYRCAYAFAPLLAWTRRTGGRTATAERAVLGALMQAGVSAWPAAPGTRRVPRWTAAHSFRAAL